MQKAYKDVIHEDAIKVGSVVKAPDYCFRIGGTRKFFLEAKKPAVNIKEDISPAYQLRRYAWSAKLPLSILTDFEELAVYDCRIKPVKIDKASKARTYYLTYTDYIDRWDEIALIFSREAVLKGSFDKYVESSKAKRGTAEVDTAFLEEIDRWREILARNIALRNPGLTRRELNFAVQCTIDRIVFLRICEDRGVERYGRLMSLKNGTQVYPRLCQLFRQADDRYNSGLFHFRKEKDSTSSPDDLTLDLTIDDKTLKDIFKNLCYPDSPYEFSVFQADILGQVYERFLGKVIRLTPCNRAVVENKPEIKKAVGVYYTPTYIVDYIVKHTVGELVDGKKPGPRGAVSKLKILDPACGSGSFLIGDYQYLLDWHRDQYIADGPEKWAKGRKPRLYQVVGSDWRLTTDERKRILLNNIYGVDIDPQAVEVTKLSLLLKVLEDENSETIRKQLALFHERVLPDLGNNIKCGNSLIGPDFYEGQQMSLLDEEDMYRVNVFDWKAEFSEIMGVGGFDAVIGNPPYVRIQAMKEWAPLEVEFYKKRYIAASKGNYDIYVVFVEKGLSLLNGRGRFGFILPHKFFNAQYGESLRKLLAAGKHLKEIIHFGDRQVFAKATTYTCLLFLNKQEMKAFKVVKVNDLLSWRQDLPQKEGNVLTDKVTADNWNFVVGPGAKLFERLMEMPIKLGDVAHLFVGLQTDADGIYIVEEVKRMGSSVFCRSKETGQVHEFENNHLKRFVKGSLNIRRYHLSDLTKRLIFPYEMRNKKSVLLSAKDYQERYPLTWAYLEANKSRLSLRGKGCLGNADWFGYVYKKNHTRFNMPKLLVPSIAKGSCFATDIEGKFYFVGSGGGGGPMSFKII